MRGWWASCLARARRVTSGSMPSSLFSGFCGDGMEPLVTRLARAKQLAHHPRIRVDSPELLLGTRYTLDTVRELKRLYPHAHFVWLMGADILPQLVRWLGWRELFE